MPSAFTGLGVGARRRNRRGGSFALAMPVPVYRLRVQAVFGHLLDIAAVPDGVHEALDLAGDAAGGADQRS